jgi:hypothetical protein
MESVFSIGIKTKKNINKKKKIIPKRGDIYISVYKGFKIHEGLRWKIPINQSVSKSISAKFSSLEIINNLTEIKSVIREKIKNIKFRFDVWPETPWKAPQFLTSLVQSYYAKQENEWNKVQAIYFRVFYLKRILKPLVFRWRIHRALKNTKNIEDPGTLEIPKKPIYIIDIENGISFIYEANTLKRSIESKILLSDYMFPTPRKPVNLLTNSNLTYKELISVLKQCKQHGETSWIIDGLWKHDGDVSIFMIYYKQQLKIEAINSHFRKTTYAIRDEVIDYFVHEAELIYMPEERQNRFISAYDNKPGSILVQQWIQNTKEYYIAKELQDLTLTLRNQKKTTGLLNSIYYAYA